jgi:hypothetical protein
MQSIVACKDIVQVLSKATLVGCVVLHIPVLCHVLALIC